MANVAIYARRILAATRRGSSTEPVFPGYLSLDKGHRPSWWKDELIDDVWGTVLGVHESRPDTRTGSIVVTEMGLALLGDDNRVIWLSYADIDGWDKLSKEPVSQSLLVRTKKGDHVELPFPQGGAFAFVQFLSSAIREHARQRAENDPKPGLG